MVNDDDALRSDHQISLKLMLTSLLAFAIASAGEFLLKLWVLSHLNAQHLEVALVSDLLFPFGICAALVVVRGDLRSFLGPVGTNTSGNAAVGVAIGLLASVSILPVAFGKTNLWLERVIAFSAFEMRPWGLLGLAVLILGLPVVGELVFRGIALEGLREHVSFPVAAAMTCVFYVLFWPALNPLSRFVFAALSVASYRKTGGLVSSVIANAILATASCCAALWHSVR